MIAIVWLPESAELIMSWSQQCMAWPSCDGCSWQSKIEDACVSHTSTLGARGPLVDRCRSGSAVKRSQTLAFGSPLGSQHGRRRCCSRGRCGIGRGAGLGGQARPQHRQAPKRKALLDILEKASPPDPHRISTSCGFPSLHAIADNGCFLRLAGHIGPQLLCKVLKSGPPSRGSSNFRITYPAMRSCAVVPSGGGGSERGQGRGLREREHRGDCAQEERIIVL